MNSPDKNSPDSAAEGAAVLSKSELVHRLRYADDLPSGAAPRPFLVAGPAALWLVTAGRVDVLLAEVTLTGELTERRYLFSLGPGQLLCGLGREPLEDPVELVAIGSADVVLRPLDRSALFASANDAGDGEAAKPSGQALLADWTTLLAQSARVLSGTGQLPPLPDFAALPQPAAAAAALTQCQRSLMKALTTGKSQERAQEKARLRALALQDTALVRKSLAGLAAVLTDEQHKEAIAFDPDAPLYTACKRVWRALGIEVGPLPKLGPELGARDPLLALAQLARLRTRPVTLSGSWWRSDHGPLVALRQVGGSPVALLPDSARRYVLYDEVRGTREVVTAAVAQTLLPQAYSFYRKLPERPLVPLDLLRFCFLGTRSELVTVALLGIGSGILGTVPPFVTGQLFDTVIPSAQRSQLLQLCLCLLVVGISATLFEITRSLTIQRLEGKISAALSAAVWDRLMALPVRFFRAYSAGDLAQRAFGIQQVFRELSAHTIGTVLTGFYGLFNAGLMFLYDARHAWLGIVLALIIVAITTASGAVQLRHQRPQAALHGRLSTVVLQLLAGIAKLRVTGAETRAFTIWAKEFGELRQLALRVRAPLRVFDSVYPLFAIIVLYWVVGSAPEPHSAGRFLGFVAAFQSFLTMTTQAAMALINLSSLGPVYDRLKPLLTTVPEVEPKKVYPGPLRGDIELAHVAFRYQAAAPPILDDVSLRIEAGQFVAITGPSGSGKSTLLRLLLGFEKPSAGAIYYDGQDMSTLDLGEVRRQLGVVLQDGKLMAGSIFSNIIGSANLTQEDALRAAAMAGLDRDLAQMPMGLHTPVEEGGSTLSGGQRQRLLIARAIVNRPRILYFDEATSALDNQTQAAVTNSIDRLAATRVVIAHRLTTIVNADRIIVLQAGRIVQSGTYRELLAQPGLFAELMRRQLADEGAPAGPST